MDRNNPVKFARDDVPFSHLIGVWYKVPEVKVRPFDAVADEQRKALVVIGENDGE